MYFYLVQALKRRLILELKDSFAQHPVYQKITPFIQNRFSFEERPQYGIVVKGSSTSKVVLASDNFVGTLQSHVMLAYVGQAVYPIEWVREDLKAIVKNGMQTLPGVYYIEILHAPTNPGESGYFVVDPLLTVNDEPVFMFQSGIEREVQLQRAPTPNTLRLYENRSFLLRENVDYTVDYTTGAIQLISSFGAGSTLSADYRYPGDSIGPVEFQWNTADTTTLPGVVLAFGKRSADNQRVAVVVYSDRVDAAQVYGGKNEVSFDLDVIARDPTQMEEISDLVQMYLLKRKSLLEFEGIELLDVSMGGEGEEVADETGENFFYQASMSVQLRADWEFHIPLPLTISKATPIRPVQAGQDPNSAQSGLVQVAGDLFFLTQGAVERRDDDYERIG